MNLETIVLNEISQTQKNKTHNLTDAQNPINLNSQK